MHACLSCSIHPVTVKPDSLGEQGRVLGARKVLGHSVQALGRLAGRGWRLRSDAGGAGGIPRYLPHPSRGPGAKDTGSLEEE